MFSENVQAENLEAEKIECNGSRITRTTTGYARLPGPQYLQLMVPDTMLVLLTVDMVFWATSSTFGLSFGSPIIGP
jgi:hypothetical protein